ncbi:MAG: pectate lyase [Clostridia bacterium]|nr:pectate lyase [Clostridia bacterium]
MKKLKKSILAVIALLTAFSVPFGAAACTTDDTPDGNPGTGGQPIVIPGQDDDNGQTKPDLKPDPDPPAAEGAVQITEGQGDLEAAYVKWTALDGASWYNVYYKGENGDWTKLDAPLVRQYKTYFRADAVGLKTGKYSLKVVPYDETGNELEEKSAIKNVAVAPHERVGYAFIGTDGSRVMPGAYNEDGTLKEGAHVLYVTDENKDSITFDIVAKEDGRTQTCVGIQQIFEYYRKGYDKSPLCMRFIGNVNTPSKTENGEGDLVIGNGADKARGGSFTLEGVGDDATINGFGFSIKRSSFAEVRNLGFMNCSSKEGDNVSIAHENDHIWVHNCDMFYGAPGKDADQVKGDGALDTKYSSYITHSYNHFWDNGKCNLQGMKDVIEKEALVTYHHNWYDHSDSRHPRIRMATAHIFNNYYDGNSEYGVGVTLGASAFVENNYFRSTARTYPMLMAGQGSDLLTNPKKGTFSGEDGGVIKAYGNKFDGSLFVMVTQNDTDDKSGIDCYLASSRDEKVPADYTTKKGGNIYNNFDTAEDMYEYALDTPDVAKEKVLKYAGRMGGGDFKFTFNYEVEDGNKNIIPELKQLLTDYTSDLVKIGND